jgi:EF-hand domain pair
VIDQQRHGYLDFESIRKFLAKFKKDVKKSDVASILRRMDLDADGKITFREFSHGITPEYPGNPTSVTTIKDGLPTNLLVTGGNVEFNLDKKEEIRRQHDENKHNTISKERSTSPLRDYRAIYTNPTPTYQQPVVSPVKREFQDLKLKQTVEPDNQYIVDLIKMGSPIGKVIRTD